MTDHDYNVHIRVMGDDGPADTITVPASDPMDAGYTALDWYPQEAEGGQWLTPDDLEIVAIVRADQVPAAGRPPA